MSIDFRPCAADANPSHCGIRWIVDAAGLLLVAAAAAAGVLIVAGGCAPPPQATQPGGSLNPAAAQQSRMRSVGTDQPDATLIDDDGQPPAKPAPRTANRSVPPAARPTAPVAPKAPSAAAVAREAQLARQAEADAMISQAMTPPAFAPAGGPGALRVSERAVAPLADTLASIEAAQRVVVDNLRNLETAGYKASRTAVGEGKNVASQLDAAQGDLQPTQRALDVAVQGDGFLQILVYTPDAPEGRPGFTRNGNLFVSRTGELVVGLVDGYRLAPPITVPPNTTTIAIAQDGKVTATVATKSAAATPPVNQEIGQLNLARFTDPTALRPLGGGIYVDTEASGQPIASTPNDAGAGAIVQGYLESSNVELVRERLRLRFLQGWRSAIIGSLDGETLKSPPPSEPAAHGAARLANDHPAEGNVSVPQAAAPGQR